MGWNGNGNGMSRSSVARDARQTYVFRFHASWTLHRCNVDGPDTTYRWAHAAALPGKVHTDSLPRKSDRSTDCFPFLWHHVPYEARPWVWLDYLLYTTTGPLLRGFFPYQQLFCVWCGLLLGGGCRPSIWIME